MCPTTPIRVLVVEDDADLRQLIVSGLRTRGFLVVECDRAQAALEVLECEEFELVVTDLRMPGMSGLDLIGRVRGGYPRLGVVLMTAFADMQAAIEAIRLGTGDLLLKPFELDELASAVTRVHARCQRGAPTRRVWTPLPTQKFTDIVGSSDAMRAVVRQLRRIVDSDCTVLITGESGTGKELVARSLHSHGPRANKSFVAVNCAALPADLLESELFGHSKGSFTGATQEAEGLFAASEGGTLLLDEIGVMPLELQPKLLRALQERAIRSIGGRREEAFDVRIIAATNQDLDRAVEQGQFRRDLLFRLDVVRVHLPPLRERDNDVLELARHFLVKHAARNGVTELELTPEVAARLVTYEWPGNVRELDNCMQAAVAMAQDGRIRLDNLPGHLRRERKPAREPEPELPLLETVEREHIVRVLRAVGGNKAAAARILGINRVTLYRKLAQALPRAPEPSPSARRLG
jgi:two-component system, NtrC family, response regulator AtoC